MTVHGVVSPINSLTTRRSPYKGTSLIRNTLLLGPYRKTLPGVIWWSYRGGQFLMSEVPMWGTVSYERGSPVGRDTAGVRAGREQFGGWNAQPHPLSSAEDGADTTPCKVTPVILHGVISPLSTEFWDLSPINIPTTHRLP